MNVLCLYGPSRADIDGLGMGGFLLQLDSNLSSSRFITIPTSLRGRQVGHKLEAQTKSAGVE